MNAKSGLISPKKSLLPGRVPLLCLLVLAQSRKCSSALESLLHRPGQPWNTPHPPIRTYFITFPLSEPAATDHNLPAVTYLVLIFSPLVCFFSSSLFFFPLFTYHALHSPNWPLTFVLHNSLAQHVNKAEFKLMFGCYFTVKTLLCVSASSDQDGCMDGCSYTARQKSVHTELSKIVKILLCGFLISL